MKAPKRSCRHKRGEERAQSRCNDVVSGMQIKMSHPADKNITQNQVKKSPNHVDARRGKSLTGRLGEWALKRASHHATDKMRDCVYKKNAAKKVRNIVDPFHSQFFISFWCIRTGRPLAELSASN